MKSSEESYRVVQSPQFHNVRFEWDLYNNLRSDSQVDCALLQCKIIFKRHLKDFFCTKFYKFFHTMHLKWKVVRNADLEPRASGVSNVTRVFAD